MISLSGFDVQVQRLWERGLSRNKISEYLHAGHSRVQKSINKLKDTQSVYLHDRRAEERRHKANFNLKRLRKAAHRKHTKFPYYIQVEYIEPVEAYPDADTGESHLADMMSWGIELQSDYRVFSDHVQDENIMNIYYVDGKTGRTMTAIRFDEVMRERNIITNEHARSERIGKF